VIGDILEDRPVSVEAQQQPKIDERPVFRPMQETHRSAHVCTRVQDLLLRQADESEFPLEQGDWMRASSLHKMCPRLIFYARSGRAKVKETFDGKKLFVFAIGTGFHAAVQETLLPRTNILKGWWTCPKCARIHHGAAHHQTVLGAAIVRPDACDGCGFIPEHSECPKPHVCLGRCRCAFEYVEVSFRNDALRCTGHCDGILQWEDGVEEILEVKSIGTSQYGFPAVDPNEGRPPKWDHVVQAHFYMKCYGIRRARIVYVSKGDVPLSDAIHEHVVRFDESVWEGIEDVLHTCARELDAPSKRAPKRPARCDGATCDMARFCPAKGICWR